MEVDELLVSGSFNMVILRHSVSLAYRDHVDLVVRFVKQVLICRCYELW